MIPEDILQRIDDETDIVELVSEFVTLQKSGKGYKGLCPFHDDSNPSFSVSTEKNIAMCMTCKEGGRPINFYRKIKNIPFADAAYELGKKIGIEIDIRRNKTYEKYDHLYNIKEEAMKFYEVNLTNSTSGKKVIDYLERRMINDELISEFNLGYAPNDKDSLYNYLKAKGYDTTDMLKLSLVKQATDGSYYDFYRNRLIFPITNRYGRVIAFSARALDKNETSKYVNSPESEIFKKTEVLYNLSKATLEIKKLDYLIVFEGFFDVISAYGANIKNVIATMGTSLTNEHINIIKTITNNVLLAFDSDKAGLDATLKTIKLLRNAKINIKVLNITDGLDPDDYIKINGENKFRELVKNNSLDSYEFEYNYYYNNTNFSNANDLVSFERNIVKMLEASPAAITSLYRKKLAIDLNIKEEDIVINRQRPKIDDTYIPDLKPKGKAVILDNKFEVAEKRLLMLMMRSHIWYERLMEVISINDYSVLTLSTIRTKLAGYYMYDTDFNLYEFKKLLTEDELNYFENHVQTDEYWRNQTHLTEQEITKYLDYLKHTSHLRRFSFLKNLMVEKLGNGESIQKEMEELREINIKIQNLKEDPHEF